jgi:hypothetical protein
MIVKHEDRRRKESASATVEPLMVPIPEAQRFSGLSRSEIYRRLAGGDILAVKNGSRTLVVMESLRLYLASLPPATFRAPAKVVM